MMAIARGSWQGALGEGHSWHRWQRIGHHGTLRCRPRHRRPGRPEDQLAQVMRAPDTAITDRRDGRQRHPDEHHRQRRT
jgi:hypothetical protein